MSGRLNRAAREELRAAGVSEVEWTRRFFPGSGWGGDVCGCPDDRCIGFHHDADDECGCLLSLLFADLRRRYGVGAVR